MPEAPNPTPPKEKDDRLDNDAPLDLAMSSDNEVPARLDPPPRIAARFNKASNRKSCASSRRSSLSSIHSSRSNRSCHGGPQSTHIAQHLRRASIIESRRARLADKAAHAEQVRLRAQQVKAAPRNSRGEDRALAAQQARERYLAQVAASCAEEVKRAKKIAEETREKREAENLKLKEDMQEKLADAEKRRIQYQQNLRRNRATSLPLVEEKKAATPPPKPSDDNAAAQKIQRAWRYHRKRKIISEFVQLDLDVEHLQKKSFEEILSLLAEDSVLSKTASVMKLCKLLDGDSSNLKDDPAVRVLLSSFLIIVHPNQVLNHAGGQEEELTDKAKVLLISLQKAVSQYHTESKFSSSSETMVQLNEAFTDFQMAFSAWKTRDASILIETMLAQFAELDAIWQTVKNDTAGNVANDYKEGIQYNQTLLLARLKRLLGPEKAMKSVKEAIKTRRKAKGKKTSLQETRPRNSPLISDAAALQPEKEKDSQPIEAIEDEETGSKNRQSKQLHKVVSTLPSNRIIMHELSVDKDYTIAEKEIIGSRKQTNQMIFDAMRSDITAGRGEEWVVSMVEIVRSKLLGVLTPGKPLHKQISEALDTQLIASQLRMGSFSYEGFFSVMNAFLPKLVSPARDSLVKALASDSDNDYVERLAKLMNIIDLLSLDYANYVMAVSAPELIKHAADYERGYFEKDIAQSGLIKCQKWWRLARVKEAEAAASRLSRASTLTTSQRIYHTGLIDLFIALPPLNDNDVPENLELDRARIERTRKDLLRIITIASILLTAKNLLKRDVRSQWKPQAQRMWDLPTESAFESPGPYLNIIESAHALPPATKTALTGTTARVLADARNSPAVSHPVMKVLLSKVKSHVTARLMATSSEEKVRSATNASETLGAGGLAEYVGRISEIVEEIGKVRQVDWDAHGKWLDQVAAEVANGSDDGDGQN